MTDHGGYRPGAGRPIHSSSPKGIARKTQKILGDLYNREDLKPPLVLLWEAANGLMEGDDGEALPAELRIKAAIAAAAYSHSKPSTTTDGTQLPVVHFSVNFIGSEGEASEAMDGEFRDVSRAVEALTHEAELGAEEIQAQEKRDE